MMVFGIITCAGACVSLPTVYRLLGQLFVEIRGVRGQRGSFLDPTQPNVGSAISAQDHLQNTGNGTEYRELMH